MGIDSPGSHNFLSADGHGGLRSLHRLDIAVGDYSAACRMCSRCGGFPPAHRGRTLEIAMIILLIASWILLAVSALTVLVAWVAEAIDAVRDGSKKC